MTSLDSHWKRMSNVQYLLIHPAVKQSSLHSPSSSLGGGIAASHDIIIGEDGSVLCHNVKQVDPAHFDCLADVVVGCRRKEMKSRRNEGLSLGPRAHKNRRLE